MSIQEFDELISKYPVQSEFDHFSDQVSIPFLVWNYEKDNFKADNKVFYSSNRFSVELYTRKKDTILEEEKLEQFFNKHNLVWEKIHQSWINDEKVMLSAYEVV